MEPKGPEEPNRRDFLVRSAGAAGALAAFGARLRAQAAVVGALPVAPLPSLPSLPPGRVARPTVTPDGATLEARVVDGVKVFHLVAQPVTHDFAPGLKGELWGYNGRVHGPTIEAVEGDRVRIYVTNRLPTATSVHWHGQRVPSGMDGVGGLSQRPIEIGETFKYAFTLRDAGSFMYHSHHDEMTQMAMGLMGMFIVHPRAPEAVPPDHDFVYLLSEWSIAPGTRRPDPNEMTDFNVLTLNARIFPATTPLAVKQGDRVRIRIGNLSAMDHHPIHLHGHSFAVTATDGGIVPESARFPETSVLVPVGAVRVVEFVADNPGDWALHCHMTHHVMTQMGHGLPNLIGADPGKFDEALSRHVPLFDRVGEEPAMGVVPWSARGDPMAPGAGAPRNDGGDTTIPPNSVPMMGGSGPHGYITMGGMFTVMRVRAGGDEGENGWYAPPAGTQADAATPEELARDGIAP